MSDYRSIFFEMAVKALPNQFWLARGSCGGEAIIAAPNEHLARELACRIWNSNGAEEDLDSFRVERVPLILCPENFIPYRTYDAKDAMQVIGDSEFFGDMSEIKKAIETARE